MAVIDRTELERRGRCAPRWSVYSARADVALTGHHMVRERGARLYYALLRAIYRGLREEGVQTVEGELMSMRRVLRYCVAKED